MFKAAGLVSVFALHAAIASAALLPTPAPAGSSVGGLQKRAIQDDDWEEIRLIVNSQASRVIAKTYSGEPKVDGFSLGSAVLQTTSQLHQAGTISQGASFGRDFPLLIDVPDNIVTEAVLDVLPQGVAQLSERERVPALNRLLTYALLRFPWPTRHNEWFDIQDEDLQRAFEKALNAAFRDDFPPYAHQHGLPQRRLEDSMRKLGWFLGWFARQVIDIGVDRLSREVPDVLKVLDPDMMAVLYLYLGFVHGYGNCKTSDSNRYIKPRYKHTRGRDGIIFESGVDTPQKLLSSLTTRNSLTNPDGLLTTTYTFEQCDDMIYFLTHCRTGTGSLGTMRTGHNALRDYN